MRLFELTQIDEVTAAHDRALEARDWKNPREVMRWLEERGYQKKGSGSFAVAYVHPQYRRIVKISKRQDVCWLRFAYWTLKMTSNPSVPYIDWVRTYGKDDKFFIAVVEKLAPFNRQAIRDTVDVAGLAYLYAYEDWFEGDQNIERRLKEEGIIYNANAAYMPQVKKWLKTIKTGKRFINTLKAAKQFSSSPCTYDMHDGNIMYRPKDRRLVVIDPLADLNDIGFSF